MKQIAAILLTVLIGVCSSRPATRFYSLRSAGSAARPVPLRMAPVEVAAVHLPALHDREEMVRRAGRNALDVNSQNRWAAPLGEMARRVLTQDLIARLPNTEVTPPHEPVPDDARKLVVSILQFDADRSGTVVWEGSWSMVKGQATSALIKVFRLTGQCGQSGYGAQAAAMSGFQGRLADLTVTDPSKEALAQSKASNDHG